LSDIKYKLCKERKGRWLNKNNYGSKNNEYARRKLNLMKNDVPGIEFGGNTGDGINKYRMNVGMNPAEKIDSIKKRNSSECIGPNRKITGRKYETIT
jgi:hypothetical protein